MMDWKTFHDSDNSDNACFYGISEMVRRMIACNQIRFQTIDVGDKSP